VLPVLGVGRNDVGVAEEGQARSFARAGDPGDEIGALGVARDELALDAIRLQVLLEHEGGRSFPAGRVRRIDSDQVAGKAERFVPKFTLDHLIPGHVDDLGQLDAERSPEDAAVAGDVEAVSGAVQHVIWILPDDDRLAGR
jgi:hypothetical protein